MTIGGIALMFSGISIVGPLLGIWMSTGELMFVLGSLTLLRWSTYPINVPLQLLTFGVPTLGAAICWRLSSHASRDDADALISRFLDIGIRIIVPLLCMVSFMIHPVGREAYLFILYWFVPIILCLVEIFIPDVSANIVSRTMLTAWSSTFVAHALGSVMWLYTMPMDASMWQALIPIVALERCVFATSMTGIYLAWHWAADRVNQLLYALFLVA